MDKNKHITFEDFLEIMRVLRSENGCPWDRVQTHESIKNDTVEEVYELVDAINNQDDDNMCEELGDMLLHVVFHSRIAEEENRFSMDDVIQGIGQKMIFRHPHIFAEDHLETSDQVVKQWEELKKEEKQLKTHADGMHHVAKALPALIRASKIQKKAAKVGFDFPDTETLMAKMDEEMDEVRDAIIKGDLDAIEDEIGDILFQTVNLSRFFGLNAENALTKAVEKFINRFEGIERCASLSGLRLDDLSLKEMEELWDQVKEES